MRRAQGLRTSGVADGQARQPMCTRRPQLLVLLLNDDFASAGEHHPYGRRSLWKSAQGDELRGWPCNIPIVGMAMLPVLFGEPLLLPAGPTLCFCN